MDEARIARIAGISFGTLSDRDSRATYAERNIITRSSRLRESSFPIQAGSLSRD